MTRLNPTIEFNVFAVEVSQQQITCTCMTYIYITHQTVSDLYQSVFRQRDCDRCNIIPLSSMNYPGTLMDTCLTIDICFMTSCFVHIIH